MFLKVCSNMGAKKGEADGLVEHKALVTARRDGFAPLCPPNHEPKLAAIEQFEVAAVGEVLRGVRKGARGDDKAARCSLCGHGSVKITYDFDANLVRFLPTGDAPPWRAH